MLCHIKLPKNESEANRRFRNVSLWIRNYIKSHTFFLQIDSHLQIFFEYIRNTLATDVKLFVVLHDFFYY